MTYTFTHAQAMRIARRTGILNPDSPALCPDWTEAEFIRADQFFMDVAVFHESGRVVPDKNRPMGREDKIKHARTLEGARTVIEAFHRKGETRAPLAPLITAVRKELGFTFD
jgi:hypothetical protein